MMLRRLAVVVLLLLAVPWPAAAQEVPPVDVVEVSGPLDEVAIDFLIDAVSDTDAQVVIIQLDSPGAVSEDISKLESTITNAAVPVVVWAGPDPAVAQGRAAGLLLLADLGAAAPGVKVGYLFRGLGGTEESDIGLPFLFDRYEVEEPDALVDLVVPSLGQLVTALDGLSFETSQGPVTVDTAETVLDEEGNEVLTPIAQVRFSEISIWGRTLRLGIRPEAAFFFLVAGLTLVAFEYYAAGTGVMAAVAIASLFIAGYGMTQLPLRWWAVVSVLLGLLLYVGDFQRNALGWRSIVGTVLLWAGGMWFTDAAPLISPVWWAVVLVVLGTALFFGIAMTAVVRSRFGTITIGREHLIGKIGTAVSSIAPVGPVDVDGAKWRAKSTRASGIEAGDRVEIVAVDGIELEVVPLEEEAQTPS